MGQARTALSQKEEPKADTPPAGAAPQSDIRKAMSDADYGGAVNSAPYMAAAYARADEATRARLRAANPDLNFDELAQDDKAIQVGSSLIDNNPAFFEAFNARLPEVSQEKAESAFTEPVSVEGVDQTATETVNVGLEDPLLRLEGALP